MTTKSALIGVTAIAIALTSFDMRPVAAAPEGGPAIVKKNAGADEISAQRKRRYRGNPAVPLAAFGAIVGTIGAVAAANNRRAYDDSYYHAPRYGYYEEPAYGTTVDMPVRPLISTPLRVITRGRSTNSATITAAGVAPAASSAIAART